MRVHELAKELSNELGKTIASSELIAKLSDKKEGLKAQSSVSEDLIKYIKDIYLGKSSNKSAENVEKQVIKEMSESTQVSDLQNQINQLQLQNALCGVIRYPQSTTYTAGYAPMYGTGCGCNGTF